MAKSAIEEIRDFFSNAAQKVGNAIAPKNPQPGQPSLQDLGNQFQEAGQTIGQGVKWANDRAGLVLNDLIQHPEKYSVANALMQGDLTRPLGLNQYAQPVKPAIDFIGNRIVEPLNPVKLFSSSYNNTLTAFDPTKSGFERTMAGVSVPLGGVIQSFNASPAGMAWNALEDPALRAGLEGVRQTRTGSFDPNALVNNISGNQVTQLGDALTDNETAKQALNFSEPFLIAAAQILGPRIKNMGKGKTPVIQNAVEGNAPIADSTNWSKFMTSKKASGFFKTLSEQADNITPEDLRLKINEAGIANTAFGKQLLQAADTAEQNGHLLTFALEKSKSGIKQPLIPKLSFLPDQAFTTTDGMPVPTKFSKALENLNYTADDMAKMSTQQVDDILSNSRFKPIENVLPPETQAKLSQLGYSADDIAKVTQDQADNIIGGQVSKVQNATSTSPINASRPQYELDFEKAFNDGNQQALQQAFDSIPAESSYKSSATDMMKLSGGLKPIEQPTSGIIRPEDVGMAKPEVPPQIKETFTAPEGTVQRAAQEQLGVPIPKDATGDAVNDLVSTTPKSADVSGIEKIGQKPADTRNFGQKIVSAYKKFYSNWFNDRQFAEDWAKELGLEKKMQAATGGMDGVGSKIDDTLNHRFFPILEEVGQSSKNDFKDYLVTMHDIEAAQNGIKGSDLTVATNKLNELRARVGDEEFTRIAGLADDYYALGRDLMKENLLDTGIISQQTYDNLVTKWQHYIPFKRQLNEFNPYDDLDKYMSFSSASPQGLLHKLEGSDRLIKDPIEETVRQYGKMIAAGSNQRFNNVIFEMADASKGTPYEGMFKIIRDADNVAQRNDILSQIKDTAKERSKAARLIKTRNSWVKNIQGELDALNAEGYDKYIQKAKVEAEQVGAAEKQFNATQRLSGQVKDAWAYSEKLQPLKDDIKSLLTDQKGDATQLQGELDRLNKLGLKQYLADGASADAVPPQTVNVKNGQLSARQTMKLVKNLISKDTPELNAIKESIGQNNQRLANTIDNIVVLKTMLSDTKELKPLQGKLQSVVNTLERSMNDARAKYGAQSDVIGPIQPSTKMTVKQTKDLINNLVQQEPKAIQAIRNKIATRDTRLAKVFDDITALKQFSDEANAQIKEGVGTVNQLADIRKRMEDSVVTRYHNGVVEKMVVPHDLSYAVNSIGAERMNTFLRIFSEPTNFFRMTATGLNPDFWARNVFRDMQTAFVNGLSNPFGFASGLYHMLRNDDVYKRFEQGGGTPRRFFDLSEKHIERMAGDAFGLDPLSPINVGRKTAGSLKNALEYMGKTAELPLRIDAFEREYAKSLQEGLGRDYAMGRGAYAAQNVTVNWSRHGSKMPPLNAVYAFMNARLQGADLFARNMIRNPAGTSARLAGGILAPAFALYEWNRQYPRFFDPRVVSDQDKKNNFIVMLPFGPVDALGGAEYIKIPKSEVGKLANPLEAFLHNQDGKLDSYGGDNAANNALISTITAFLPVDYNTNNTATENLVRALMPTAIQPIANVAFNKDLYTGLPIVQENQVGYSKYGGQKYQYNSWTSPFYRYVADVIDKTSGQKLSPAQIQAIVQGYGTGWANIAANIYSNLPDSEQYKTGKNGAKLNGADVSRMPVVRGLFGGEKYTEEEYQNKLINQGKSINYDLQDISKGIAKGVIPVEEGQQMIQQAVQEQIKAMNKANGIETPPTETPAPTNKTSDAGGLIPSAEAAVNPLDVAQKTDVSGALPSLQQLATQKLMDSTFQQAYAYSPTDATARAFGKDPTEARYQFIDSLKAEDKAKYVAGDLLQTPEGDGFDQKALEYIDKDIMTTGTVNDMLQRRMISVDQANHLKDLISNYQIALGIKKAPKGKKFKAPSASIITGKIRKISTGGAVKLGSGISLNKIKLSSPKSSKTKISIKPYQLKPSTSTYRVKPIGRVKTNMRSSL